MNSYTVPDPAKRLANSLTVQPMPRMPTIVRMMTNGPTPPASPPRMRAQRGGREDRPDGQRLRHAVDGLQLLVPEAKRVGPFHGSPKLLRARRATPPVRRALVRAFVSFGTVLFLGRGLRHRRPVEEPAFEDDRYVVE